MFSRPHPSSMMKGAPCPTIVYRNHATCRFPLEDPIDMIGNPSKIMVLAAQGKEAHCGLTTASHTKEAKPCDPDPRT